MHSCGNIGISADLGENACRRLHGWSSAADNNIIFISAERFNTVTADVLL